MGFLPFVFPLAELEVGQHLYWQIGNFRIHGQVFMTSWLLIGALLALVVIGTKKMERDPKGARTFWSSFGITFVILQEHKLVKRFIEIGCLSSEPSFCSYL